MKNRNILILDDEVLILRTLHMMLSRNGFSAFTASDGNAGLTLIKEHGIRVVLTDLRMPKMDGLEFCRQVKKAHPDAIVYAISAYVNKFSPEQLKEAGFEGWFEKPYDVNEVTKACDRAFARLG